jgi:hypothetical protein
LRLSGFEKEFLEKRGCRARRIGSFFFRLGAGEAEVVERILLIELQAIGEGGRPNSPTSG